MANGRLAAVKRRWEYAWPTRALARGFCDSSAGAFPAKGGGVCPTAQNHAHDEGRVGIGPRLQYASSSDDGLAQSSPSVFGANVVKDQRRKVGFGWRFYFFWRK
jgi:hypothetical protein